MYLDSAVPVPALQAIGPKRSKRPKISKIGEGRKSTKTTTESVPVRPVAQLIDLQTLN